MKRTMLIFRRRRILALTLGFAVAVVAAPAAGAGMYVAEPAHEEVVLDNGVLYTPSQAETDALVASVERAIATEYGGSIHAVTPSATVVRSGGSESSARGVELADVVAAVGVGLAGALSLALVALIGRNRARPAHS